MPKYFYVTTLCVVTVSMVIYEMYLFNKGKYYPYLIRNKEDSFKKIITQNGLLMIFTICVYSLSTNHTATPLVVLVMISLGFCQSILNYLSYRKIKDRKIIYQTVIFDISLFAFLFIMSIIAQKG